ncbi:unnamed protein product [Caenorhabditis sp. 36 PRJEB53466]|nr:unnamed protein product [Caenorhabditis sp. 36 PRJEB53466]
MLTEPLSKDWQDYCKTEREENQFKCIYSKHFPKTDCKYTGSLMKVICHVETVHFNLYRFKCASCNAMATHKFQLLEHQKRGQCPTNAKGNVVIEINQTAEENVYKMINICVAPLERGRNGGSLASTSSRTSRREHESEGQEDESDEPTTPTYQTAEGTERGRLLIEAEMRDGVDEEDEGNSSPPLPPPSETRVWINQGSPTYQKEDDNEDDRSPYTSHTRRTDAWINQGSPTYQKEDDNEDDRSPYTSHTRRTDAWINQGSPTYQKEDDNEDDRSPYTSHTRRTDAWINQGSPTYQKEDDDEDDRSPYTSHTRRTDAWINQGSPTYQKEDDDEEDTEDLSPPLSPASGTRVSKNCGTTEWSRETIMNNFWREAQSSEQQGKTKLYKCVLEVDEETVCGQIGSFNSIHNHLAAHLKLERFECQKCGRRVLEKIDLATHAPKNYDAADPNAKSVCDNNPDDILDLVIEAEKEIDFYKLRDYVIVPASDDETERKCGVSSLVETSDGKMWSSEKIMAKYRTKFESDAHVRRADHMLFTCSLRVRDEPPPINFHSRNNSSLYTYELEKNEFCRYVGNLNSVHRHLAMHLNLIRYKCRKCSLEKVNLEAHVPRNTEDDVCDCPGDPIIQTEFDWNKEQVFQKLRDHVILPASTYESAFTKKIWLLEEQHEARRYRESSYKTFVPPPLSPEAYLNTKRERSPSYRRLKRKAELGDWLAEHGNVGSSNHPPKSLRQDIPQTQHVHY